MYRSITGRMARWTEEGLGVLTPNVFFYDSVSRPAPAFAELLASRTAGGGFELSSRPPNSLSMELPSALRFPLSFLKRRESAHCSSTDGLVLVSGHPDLIGPEVEGTDAAIYALGNAFEMRRDARDFVRSVVSLRRAVGQRKLLYAPGMMEPSNLALLCYAGVDLFDSSLPVYQGSLGRLTMPEGTLQASDAPWLLPSLDEGSVIGRNVEAVWQELNLVRHMIRAGRLRELVETRSASSPWSVAVLRLLDFEHYEYQEQYAPVVGPRFYCNSKQSLYRPDVLRFRKRIMERYASPPHKRVLLLLPCSARKPYSHSRSHRMFAEVIRSVRNSVAVHEVIVTSPLGIVPREVELVYPAAHYDIPVTGHWDRDEVAMVQEMISRISSFQYEKVISHLSDEESFVRDVVDCIDTSGGRPTASDSLEKLRAELERACSALPSLSWSEERFGTVSSIARFQFGRGGDALVEGCDVVGNYPYLRVMASGNQIAMLTPERGMLSLTMRGGQRLIEIGVNRVEMADFDLEGNLFAIGVEGADPGIRTGDEVVVLRNGEPQAVGVAMMCGEEMVESERGEAVRVRHRIKK